MIQSLTELALDVRWAWNHRSDELWAQLDPDLWRSTRNPWVILQTVSKKRLAAFLAEPETRDRIARLLEQRRQHHAATSWFEREHPASPLTTVAYFSMEFALTEALPIYSGGLGNVAGDQLKAACDLGVPVIGVGLLYQQGYFRQAIRSDGSQQALYPYNDPGQLPIRPVRDSNGEWLRVSLAWPAYEVWLRAWEVRVDRQVLYLLDSNDASNPPIARAITSELYGGDAELRLQQEIVLGIGGWRLLQALGLKPEVCHLNEGHAALAILERARAFAEANATSFDEAVMATRAGNVFTTHTAVPAGFDRFPPSLIDQYLRPYAEDELGITLDELLALGREHARDVTEPFNMAYLALRGSGAVNGVSRLHGEVSRRLFQPLFPRWPATEVPVGHVTNGIHVPTWDSPEADALWTAALGSERWRDSLEAPATGLDRVADLDLWALRNSNRKALVHYVRERLSREMAVSGAGPERVTQAREALDPEALTLGFARRFASYKRPTLLLRSPERLIRLLTDARRPVQLVIAGKAHPADSEGQRMIGDWVRFSQRPEVGGRIVFVSDYDLLLAEYLVQGVDVWVNTPRRPWEASGTSGMKVLVNGGLNLSELDGWWAEAYTASVGWAVGDGREHGDDPAWDAAEAESLHALLEDEIVPAFYTRDERGIPGRWLAKMRASMATLTPRFSTNRVVREYTERYYLDAAAAHRKRSADRGALAARLMAWRRHLSDQWPTMRFGALRVETRGAAHYFTVQLDLGGVQADAIRVELFADPANDGEPLTEPMMFTGPSGEAGAGAEFVARVPASRPASDFTPRVVAYHPDAYTPLEAPWVLWQR